MKFDVKVPLWTKIIVGTLTAVIMVGVAIYFFVSAKQWRSNIYKSEIHSIVIKSNEWHKRSIEFHLENGNTLYFMPSSVGEKIAIGDSIAKPSNTFLYKVYRKSENGEQKLINIYDAREIY